MRNVIQKLVQTSHTKGDVSIQSGGTIVIDGKEFRGNNVSIINNQVIVDGVKQDGTLVGDISVEVYGDVERVETMMGSISCVNATNVSTQSGDVEATTIHGNVSTMSGDVEADQIGGSVSTMSGDIN